MWACGPSLTGVAELVKHIGVCNFCQKQARRFILRDGATWTRSRRVRTQTELNLLDPRALLAPTAKRSNPSGGPAGPEAATRTPGMGSRKCGNPLSCRCVGVYGSWAEGRRTV